MLFKENNIWKKTEDICPSNQELAFLEKMCEKAVDLMKTVRDTFPEYTLHDGTHISNVLRLMEMLLGEEGIENLSLGECEMLLLSACYHDVGMCYFPEMKEKELKNARFQRYLDDNSWANLLVKDQMAKNNIIPENVKHDFFRSIHHMRVAEFLPEKLDCLHIRRDYLIKVCQSHGEDITKLQALEYDSYGETDCYFCAVILRLADVLDFDRTRTPEVLYHFQNIKKNESPVTRREWLKHMSSQGFKFCHRAQEEISFHAVCDDMQIEHEIGQFIDYIEQELKDCKKNLCRYGHNRWKGFYIPEKVVKNIERNGYRTGEYCLTLDAERVLQLLVGNDLYASDTVFIREIVQNAFDAVYARKLFDEKYECESLDAHIRISGWYDTEGKQWVRIDDFGIGMTAEMILEYFLKVGRSFYQSDVFKIKSREHRNGFIPISKFGIGILSCFLNGDRMEIATRHCNNGNGIRFSMTGIRGYYSIAEEEQGDKGIPMPSVKNDEISNFRQTPGTSIAVKLKEAITEDLEEVLKKYICYPDLKVEFYDGYKWNRIPTEQDLKKIVQRIPCIHIPLSEEHLNIIKETMPYHKWKEAPYLIVKCTWLENISGSPYIKGADVEIALSGEPEEHIKRTVLDTEIIYSFRTNVIVTKKGFEVRLYYEINVHNQEKPLMRLYQLWEEYKNQNEVTRMYADKLEKRSDDVEGSFDITKEIVDDMNFLWDTMKMNEKVVTLQIPFDIHVDLDELMNRFLLPRCMNMSGSISTGFAEFVYNGIVVGKNWENNFMEESQFRYTVVLLSGEYQPILGMSRDNIRYFPIEAAADIELVGMKIRNNALTCDFKYYTELELRDYDNIAEKFYSLAESELKINWKESIKDIKEKVKIDGEKYVVTLRSFQDDDLLEESPYRHFYFLNSMLKVILHREFDVRWYQNENGFMEYQIVGLRDDPIPKAESYFMPLMFIKPMYTNKKILTEGDRISRNAINSEHPFSVWFLDNTILLYEKYNSIFKKIRRYLREYNSSEMIVGINELLRQFERCSSIRIPNDVWLKSTDFISNVRGLL